MIEGDTSFELGIPLIGSASLLNIDWDLEIQKTRRRVEGEKRRADAGGTRRSLEIVVFDVRRSHAPRDRICLHG